MQLSVEKHGVYGYPLACGSRRAAEGSEEAAQVDGGEPLAELALYHQTGAFRQFFYHRMLSVLQIF